MADAAPAGGDPGGRGSGPGHEEGARRLAEQALEYLPIPIAAHGLGPDPDVFLLNRAFVETFGWTLDDIPTLGAWVERAYPDPVERARVTAWWEGACADAAARGGRVAPTDTEITCRDGTVRNVVLEAAAADGVLIVSLLDVTDRRAAELTQASTLARLQEAQRAAHIGSWELDARTGSVWWSAETYRVFGRDPATDRPPSVEAFWDELVVVEDRHAARAAFEAALAAREPIALRARARVPGDRTVHVEILGKAEFDDTGTMVRAHGTTRDVTEQALAEERLRTSETRLARVLQGTSDGYWDWNVTTNDDFHSPRYKELLGYTVDEFGDTAQDFWDSVHPDDLPGVLAAEQAHLERREPYDIEFRMRTKSGEYRWFRSRGQAEWDENGKARSMAGTLTDITERKALEEEIREQNQLFTTVLSNLDANVYIKDREGRFLYVNPAVERILGRPASEIVGRRDVELMPADEVAQARDLDRSVFRSGARQSREESMVDGDGTTRHFWTVKMPLADAGRPDALIGFSTDVTELHALREELERRATTDSLTGLANRGHFLQRIEVDLTRAQRYGEALSLLVLDIDHFKAINDTFGHQAGDRVLRGAAELFRQSLRASDLIGRIGGEEFAVLLPHTDLDDAVSLAERLRSRLARSRFAVESGERLGVTVSIGATALLPDDHSLEALFARADRALYRAKESGRNQVEDSKSGSLADDVANLRLIWRPGYASGHPVIDADHRQLFRLANELLDLAVADPPPDAFVTAFDELMAHARAHFLREEALLRRLAYPDLAHHVDRHRRLVDQALDLRARAVVGAATYGALVEFLSQQFIARHLLRDDRAFFELLAAAETDANRPTGAGSDPH